MLTPISEAVAVLGVNQLSPLSQTPDPASPISLIVNGAHTFTAADPAPAFIVSGTAIAWVSPIYSVTPSDTVVALYYAYLE